MTPEVEPRNSSRLSREMLEMADEMRALGIMDDKGYVKVAGRHTGKGKMATVAAPLQSGAHHSPDKT